MFPAIYPRGFSPRLSNFVTMTDVYNHNANTPQIMGSQMGQSHGMFTTDRSLSALAVVQRLPSPNSGEVQAYLSRMLIRERS